LEVEIGSGDVALRLDDPLQPVTVLRVRGSDDLQPRLLVGGV